MAGQFDFGSGGAVIAPPVDTTAPVITSAVAGDLGLGGWHTSDVVVSWTVSDPESASAITLLGCNTLSVTEDVAAAASSCGATSPGGAAATQTVQVKRDATAPVLTFTGATSYTVADAVTITCAAQDAMSGVETSVCAGVSRDAYTLAPGTHVHTANASDLAGNEGSATISYTVGVDSGSLCTLTQRFVTKTGVATSLCAQLRNGAFGAYASHLRAQSGKSISVESANILLGLVAAL